MAAQAIWSGTIGFSLVAIPVRLVKAIEPGRIPFHLLHAKDHSRLVRTMICPEDGAAVPPDEIVRGYEIAPDRHVLMTDEELDSVTPERSRTIEIIEFTDLKEIDPIYFDHPYYLVPSKGGEKAYRLLAEAMRRTNKAGLAKFVLSEREYLVAVTNRDGALAVTTLHYSDEVLPVEDPASATEVVADEAALMRERVLSMTAELDLTKYADERRNRIKGLLAEKVKEHGVVEAPAAPDEIGDGPPDLVAALEESMRRLKEAG